MKRGVAAAAVVLTMIAGCAPLCDLDPDPRPNPRDASGRFTPEALRQDWDVLACALRTQHAGLTLFLPRSEFDRLVRAGRAALVEPQSTLEFLPRVAELVGQIRDRHTVCGPPEAGDGFELAPRQARLLLPLDIVVEGPRAFVDDNGSGDPRLTRGVELLALDGEPIAAILDRLRALLPTDGFAEGGRERDLERRFPDLLHWYVRRPGAFRVTARRAAGDAAFEILIPALSADQRRAALAASGDALDDRASNDASRAPAVYELLWQPEADLACLRIFSFARRPYRETDRNYEHVYDEVFDALAARGVRGLLLDLRDNPGGRTEYMRELLSYFMPELRAEVLYAARSASGERGVVWLPRPESDAYRGRLAVLINAGTGSAAAQLAELLRRHCGALVLGEESGDRADGFTAGSFHELVLPNSRIAVSIPRWEYRLEGVAVERGRAVVPDVAIPTTALERLAAPNRARERAMELLRGRTADRAGH